MPRNQVLGSTVSLLLALGASARLSPTRRSVLLVAMLSDSAASISQSLQTVAGLVVKRTLPRWSSKRSTICGSTR